MKRAQIYLEDAEYEALREAAFKRRTSISGVLRHLIQVSIVGKPAKSKKRYAAGLLELAGIFHDTRRDISERHDDYAWGDAPAMRGRWRSQR